MKNIFFLCLNAIQFVPYAYGTLRSYTQENQKIRENYRWMEPIWRMDPVDDIVAGIEAPAVLCASCYVWNHNHHCHIASQVKKRYPGCKVVFGGPHVPTHGEDYFQSHPYVDVLVHHEGEIPFMNLLLSFLEENEDVSAIEGITYNQNGRAIHTGGNPRLPKDLPIPSPYLNGLFDGFIESSSGARIGLWETNRGCPFACSFCDWGVRTMNRLRLHDFEKVAAEIVYMARKQIADLYITDCNFGIFQRDLEFARLLVEAKKKYGYPKRVRIQFAKKSNDTVFKISQLLNENDMLWGTTLSMQSVDMNVLRAVDRQHIGIENYKKLKTMYSAHGIPTYTELILGLPLETRGSFVGGICSLFEIGIHDDIRVFELALLPNAPLALPEERKKYGLRTQFRPLRQVLPGQVPEVVELVFETSTMSYEDWAYCLLFGETIQAIHNGGYTRFLAIYLNDTGRMSYQEFYDSFLQYMLRTADVCFDAIRRGRTLIDDFYNDPEMPQIQRLLVQPDIMAFLSSYNPRRKGWQLWAYIWLWITEHIESFYGSLSKFLSESGIEVDDQLEELLRYQKEIMITLDYNPNEGKTVSYDHNWHGLFFQQQPLRPVPCRLTYTDSRMGVSHRFALKKNDRISFTRAAIGISYPYSKHLHFFHQPDVTRIHEAV
jgi:putative methyltransferase